MYRQSEKNCQTAICPPHVLIIWWMVRLFGAPQQISTGFASCLLCCSDVANRRPTKLCKMFGRLLGCYIIYTFSAAVAPDRILPGAKFTLRSKSWVLLYWQRYCMSLQQRASAKLCGVVQGMELPNFRWGCHLYSAGRSSRRASAHIVVRVFFEITETDLKLQTFHTPPVSAAPTESATVGISPRR